MRGPGKGLPAAEKRDAVFEEGLVHGWFARRHRRQVDIGLERRIRVETSRGGDRGRICRRLCSERGCGICWDGLVGIF